MSPEMKRLAYITAVILSLLIIYLGREYLLFIIAVPVVRLCRAVVPMAVPNVRSLILAIQRKIVEKRAVRQLSISPI